MSNPKIALRDLHLYYGDFHALKGLSMEIPEKEITAFIGPSGCGKSTCLKTLNRMNDLVEGCKITGGVFIDGEDIYAPQTDVTLLRRRAGMVFKSQIPSLCPSMIILHTVRACTASKKARARRDCGALPAGGCTLGRGERPAQKICARPLRWPTSTPLHCPRAGSRAGYLAHG